jgi:hypothetical protein
MTGIHTKGPEHAGREVCNKYYISCINIFLQFGKKSLSEYKLNSDLHPSY